MSKFHNRYFLNKEAAEHGNWIDFGDGIAVCARRANSMHSQAARRRILNELQHKADADGEFSEEVMTEVGRRVMAESVILAWKGVTDENDKPIPCDYDGIMKVMTEYEDFGAELFNASIQRTNYQKVVTENDLGN